MDPIVCDNTGIRIAHDILSQNVDTVIYKTLVYICHNSNGY